MKLTAAGMENAMTTSGSGPIAAAANTLAPRTPNGAFRRGAAPFRVAAVFLMVLAPIGCRSEEPAYDPDATTDASLDTGGYVVDGGSAGGETTYEPMTTGMTTEGFDPGVVAGGSATGATNGCPLAGTWEQSTPGVGTTTWEITASGKATETGLGYAKGTATFAGNVLRIDWKTENGWSGNYQWTLRADCTADSGRLEFLTGRTGTLSSTVKWVR